MTVPMRPLGVSLLSVALHASVAGASNAAELEWRAPERCPDADELRFRLERAVGMPLSHAAPLRLLVNVEPAARGFVAHIEVGPDHGAPERRRALSASGCDELGDMVTVALAIALGAAEGEPPDAAPAERRVASTARPAVVPLDVSLSDTAPSSAPPPASSRDDAGQGKGASTRTPAPWWPGLSLWLVGDTGSLPDPGVGVALEARVEHARLQLRATGTWYRGQHEALPGAADPAPGADLGLMTGALALCAVPFGGSRLEAFGGGGWELGWLSGEGTGVQRPREGGALWSAPKVDAGASLGLGASGLRVAMMLTLAAPLARENFVLIDLGAVHRPPGVVGRGAIGLEWTLK